MSYTFVWDQDARRSLDSLPKDVVVRILTKLNSITENPHHFLEKRKDLPGYKLRIGDYRVILDILYDKRILWIWVVGHRKKIYKNLRE